MTAAFEIREVGDDDLAEVVALLCEGFPRRTPEYWRTGLQKLANRERPPDTDKYGYVLTAGNELRGVVLTIPRPVKAIDHTYSEMVLLGF
jgi:hypothetical protein